MAHPVCSECGLPWSVHGVRVDEVAPTVCVRLLRAEVHRLRSEAIPSKDRVRDLLGNGHQIREVIQS